MRGISEKYGHQVGLLLPLHAFLYLWRASTGLLLRSQTICLKTCAGLLQPGAATTLSSDATMLLPNSAALAAFQLAPFALCTALSPAERKIKDAAVSTSVFAEYALSLTRSLPSASTDCPAWASPLTLPHTPPSQ